MVKDTMVKDIYGKRHIRSWTYMVKDIYGQGHVWSRTYMSKTNMVKDIYGQRHDQRNLWTGKYIDIHVWTN